MGNVKQVFKGRLLNLFIMKKTLPNGYRGTFEMIRHPGAALVVPFLSRDRIIMLRQLRPVIGLYIYELVAGTLDKGETPLACARREIIEETGYFAARLKSLGKIYPVPGYSTERIFMFRADGLKKVERCAEEDEVIETHVLTRGDVAKLLKQGRIVDAKTICALAVCGWI